MPVNQKNAFSQFIFAVHENIFLIGGSVKSRKPLLLGDSGSSEALVTRHGGHRLLLST